MRRDGAGFVNGTGTTRLLWYLGVSASRGSTDTPSPDATMFLTVSSEFVRAVGAPRGFLIHDALLDERGCALVARHVTALSSTTLVDVRDTRPWQP